MPESSRSTELRFYLDENVPVEVAEQLARSAIDIVSARSLERLGWSDVDHLHRAHDDGRVLCTHDQDFLRLAAQGRQHAGIAFAEQYGATIGGWVRALRKLHGSLEAEALIDRVVFLTLR